MSLPSPAARPWWRHPGPLAALLLHFVIFLGLFQFHFQEGEWSRLADKLPPGASTGQWLDQLVEDHGPLGVLKWFFDTHKEIGLYHHFTTAILDGVDTWQPPDTPGQGTFRVYREVPAEYQPGALLVLLPPALFASNYDNYVTAFVVWCGVLHGASLWLALRLLAGGAALTPAQAGRALWSSALFLLFFGSVASARFDHVVPLACLVSIALFQRAVRGDSLAWFAACGAAIAGGVLIKIVPGVVLPAGLLWLLVGGARPWRSGIALVAGFALTLLSLHALFQFWWGDGYIRSYTYHLVRGIQLETLYAGVLLAAQGFGLPYELAENYGAAHLATPLTPFLKALSTALFFGVSAIVAWRFWRQRQPRAQPDPAHALVVLTTAFLLGFILTNKVLSPQYLLWVGPLLAALYGLRPAFRPALLLLFAACVISQIIFPHCYDQLLLFYPGIVALLNVRNALLVALFGWLVWRLPRLLAPPRADDSGVH